MQHSHTPPFSGVWTPRAVLLPFRDGETGDPESPGLRVRGRSDRATWRFTFRWSGRQRVLTLGSWPEMDVRGQMELRNQRRHIAKLRLTGAPKQWEPPLLGIDGNKNGGRKVGRNDPCPCGSGLKFKKCHGARY